jgi:hypothetical protein
MATRSIYSRSHDAVIRVYDEGGNLIERYEHAGEFRSAAVLGKVTGLLPFIFSSVATFEFRGFESFRKEESYELQKIHSLWLHGTVRVCGLACDSDERARWFDGRDGNARPFHVTFDGTDANARRFHATFDGTHCITVTSVCCSCV